MRLGFLRRLAGYYIFEMARIDCEAFLNLCMRYGFPYLALREGSVGKMLVDLPVGVSARLQAACRARRIGLKKVGSGGLIPRVVENPLSALRRALALALSALLLFFAQGIIWRVDISGNEETEEEHLYELLRECGVAAGSRISGLDTDRAEQLFLLREDGISWISVNIDGVVASVQVRETSEGEDKRHGVGKPSNLVALFDGEIELIEVYSGFICVKEGESVRAGQLLVSGIYGGEGSPLRYTSSSGRIYARVCREFEIKIPLNREVKVPTGEVFRQKTLNFFGKSIKLFINSRNLPPNCDIMNYSYAFDPFSLGALPLSVGITSYSPYTTVTERIGEAEAMELAYAELRRRIDEELPEARVLEKDISCELGEDFYVLRCKIRAVCDIARSVDFEIMGKNKRGDLYESDGNKR